MGNYIQIRFTDVGPEQREQLVAFLSEAGYEGFEEQDFELNAYITDKKYDGLILNELAYKYQLSFSKIVIPEQNWNKVWESNLQPVVVDNFVAIRANFHKAIPHVKYEIIITPKMSFGTGHHATTYMMIEQMKEIDFEGKTVLDFGTGTGILAILAEKLGAEKIYAIDIDPWSIQNAQENIVFNNCSRIDLLSGSIPEKKYDIILANINRNVILDNAGVLASTLERYGQLIISGLLDEDEKGVTENFSSYLLYSKKKYSKNKWISLLFSR